MINGSLQTLDLGKRAITALKANRGPRGLQGAQGLAGAKGDKGDKGAFSSGGGGGPILDQAMTRASTSSVTTDLVLPLQALATFAAPHTLFLACSGAGRSFSNPRLSAIQVGAIH